MLLAGNLCEEGICVKRDWDKAAGLHMRAQEAGQKGKSKFALARYPRPAGDVAPD